MDEDYIIDTFADYPVFKFSRVNYDSCISVYIYIWNVRHELDEDVMLDNRTCKRLLYGDEYL